MNTLHQKAIQSTKKEQLKKRRSYLPYAIKLRDYGYIVEVKDKLTEEEKENILRNILKENDKYMTAMNIKPGKEKVYIGDLEVLLSLLNTEDLSITSSPEFDTEPTEKKNIILETLSEKGLIVWTKKKSKRIVRYSIVGLYDITSLGLS